MSKYIQSFYQYPVTFSSLGVTFPCRGAQGEMKNLIEVSEAQLAILERSEPLFRELVKSKKYRVLNHIPQSYVPAAERINVANAEAARLREENERLRAQIEATRETHEDSDFEKPESETPLEKMDYKELQAKAKELGIENVSVKKSALIEAIKEATAE